MKDVVTMEFEGVQMDREGFLHFRAGEFEKAPDWKRFTVGLLNRMREVELTKEGK